MTELALFASTYITVFALGFQSLNVNQGKYVAAFVTSFFIGGASLVLYKMLPDASVTQCAAYLLGGATGIVSGMWFHQRMLPIARRLQAGPQTGPRQPMPKAPPDAANDIH